jgi:WhiB family redox-sensing transcriptional regulator
MSEETPVGRSLGATQWHFPVWTDLSWQVDAKCYYSDPEMFHYPEGEKGEARREREAKALAVCEGCPVKMKCLKQALAYDDRNAIMGGTTPAMRGAVNVSNKLWSLEQILHNLDIKERQSA